MSTRFSMMGTSSSLLFDLNVIFCTPRCFCRHPSIYTLSELSIARCKLGVLDSAGAATCYCDLSLDLANGVLDQGNDAGTGTRLMTLNLHISGVNYAAAGSMARTFGRSRT